MDLRDQVFLITGCSSGVGMHVAVQSAAAGGRVYASMRNPEKAGPLKALAAAEGVALHVIPLDVRDERAVRRAVAAIEGDEGRIDVLINNAGFGSVRALEQATPDQLNEILDVNFFGAVRCIRAVLPGMRARRSGWIVSVSSVGGLVGQPLNEIYCAAKFALEGLIESMATYMEPCFGIRMTLIEPAGIRTEFVNRVLSDLQKDVAPLQEVYGPVLQRYIGQLQKRRSFESAAQTPEQVAEVIVQSLRDDSTGLRTLTSDAARTFAAEKIAGDPDGRRLQQRIRRDLLGLEVEIKES
jgi:NAD(P)-dependent dehydrogenase (short-subunit alcohol dehydrogenase family)